MTRDCLTIVAVDGTVTVARLELEVELWHRIGDVFSDAGGRWRVHEVELDERCLAIEEIGEEPVSFSLPELLAAASAPRLAPAGPSRRRSRRSVPSALVRHAPGEKGVPLPAPARPGFSAKPGSLSSVVARFNLAIRQQDWEAMRALP